MTDIYRVTAANVSVPNPDTPVQFYRSSRPKTPLYALLPENIDFIECSKCRHLFLPDTAAARAEHRQWHVDHYDEYMMPCRVLIAQGGHYDVLQTCSVCTEQCCPCCECQEQHAEECSAWKSVWVLFDLGAEELADILTDVILQQRS